MSSETITSADHKMGRAVEAMERDFQAFRTGRASTALVERLTVDYYGTQTPLNQLAGISVPEAAPDRHPAVGSGRPRGDREGDPEERHRPDAERRRDGRPAQHPAADRGASQGPRARASTSGWRRPGSRSATSAATRPTSSRRRSGTATVGTDEVPPPARAAPEDDRPLDRRGRSGRRGQGAGGPGGLVARAPLARPTDAPPDGARPDAEAADPRRLRRRAGDADRLLPDRATCRATSRSSWTATAAGPASAACAELEGHAAGVEAIRDAPPPRGPARRPGRHAVRLQPRELGPLGRRGPRPVRPARGRRSGARPPSCATQGVRIRLLGRLEELPDDTRRSIDEALAATAGGDRLLLNIAFNYAGRTELVDAVRRIVASGRRRPTRSTRPPSPTRCTRPACPIRTS